MLGLRPLRRLLAVDVWFIARSDCVVFFNATNKLIKIVVIVIVEVVRRVALLYVHLRPHHLRHIGRVQIQGRRARPLAGALAAADHGQVIIRFLLLRISIVVVSVRGGVKAYPLVNDAGFPFLHEVAGEILVHEGR